MHINKNNDFVFEKEVKRDLKNEKEIQLVSIYYNKSDQEDNTPLRGAYA